MIAKITISMAHCPEISVIPKKGLAKNIQNSQPPRRPTIRDVKDQESSWNGANVKFWERERTRTPQYSSPLPEVEEVTPHFTMDDLPKADKTKGNNNNTNNLNVPAFLRRND